ncbi:hypothetical protein V1477_008501 [Vespula maculifrons]|uniref:Uncharacterized protein n=1 Tax=Vespula maculifrons TaxID=7453 RepID=A0ABD2CD77_VESMC
MQQPPRGGTWVGSTCDPASISEQMAAYLKTHPKSFLCYSKILSGGSHELGSWAWASVRVSFQYRKIELDFRTLVLVKQSAMSSKGSVHNRLLDANTGRIERTLTPMSAGTDVVFSGASKSPTVKDSV